MNERVIIAYKDNEMGAYLKGLDVSHLSVVTDWQEVAKECSFVYIKASEGKSFLDPMFKQNVLAAKEAGLLVGAYHFYRPASDLQSQVDNFTSAIKDLSAELSLPSMVDVETADATEDIQKNLEAFIALSKSKVIYTNPSFWDQHVSGVISNLTALLFIANYGVTQPKLPHGWDHWTFWQYAGDMTIPGASNVDLDYFNGTIEDLKAL